MFGGVSSEKSLAGLAREHSEVVAVGTIGADLNYIFLTHFISSTHCTNSARELFRRNR